MNAPSRRLEIAVAAFLLLLAVSAAWRAASMPAGTPSLPGPGMLPMALGVLLALTSAGLILFGLRSDQAPDRPVVVGHRNIAAVVAALLVAGVLFERAGFLVTSILFLFALFWAVSPLNWWRALLAAVGVGLAAKLFFQDLLRVSLPPFSFGLS